MDDGSTDSSASVVAGIRDGRIRLLAQANAGPGAARNRGLGEARGEYVAFLDADDEWEPEFLDLAVAALDSHPDVRCLGVGPRGRAGAREPGPAQPANGAHRRTLAAASPRPRPRRSSSTWTSVTPAASWPVARWCSATAGTTMPDRSTYGEDSYLWLMFVMNHRL